MSTFTLLREKRKQERIERKNSSLEYKRRQQAHRDAEKELFSKFCQMIKPFNRKTIGGIKIKLVFNNPKTTVELFLNDKLYRVFVAVTETHYCNCSECHEGYTGHECSYTQDINCYEIKEKNERVEDYFAWYGRTDEEKESRFIESFDALLKEYKDK